MRRIWFVWPILALGITFWLHFMDPPAAAVLWVSLGVIVLLVIRWPILWFFVFGFIFGLFGFRRRW